MGGRFAAVSVLVLAALIGLSVAGIAVMSGALRHWPTSTLIADIRLSAVQLPGELAMDPLVIAEYLEEQMGRRASNDMALRVTVGAENAQKFIDAVLPRLVNAVVIEQMIARIPPLKAAVALNEFRTVANVTIRNTGPLPIEDVAVTLPGALVAENADGTSIEVTTARTGLPVMRLGSLAAGEEKVVSIWTSVPQDLAGTLESQISVGAAQGLNASMAIYGRQGWRGEDLEVQSWARWTIAAILVSVALASLAVLAGLAASAWRRWRLNGA